MPCGGNLHFESAEHKQTGIPMNKKGVYATFNLLTFQVEQVRDTYEEAMEVARGDDCLVAYPYPLNPKTSSGNILDVYLNGKLLVPTVANRGSG